VGAVFWAARLCTIDELQCFYLTDVVGDTDSNDTGYFYAYGVTDTSSSCYCHQSNVQTTLTSTGGGYVSNSTQGGEFAEVQEAYYLQDGIDYGGDGYITATSIHNAYCPIANLWFVSQQQTVSSNPPSGHSCLLLL
jgi:hypothetical protein